MTTNRAADLPASLIDRVPTTWLFHDAFDRPDADVVGNDWIDGSTFDASEFAPLGIRDEHLCCVDPLAPTHEDKGIGCCWRDLGTRDVEATILVPPQGSHFREAAPLLHVTPGTTAHGFGAWMSTFHGKPHLGFLLVGTLGNPVVGFDALATASFPRDDRPHLLTLRSVGGIAQCSFDGEPLALLANPSRAPVERVEVPAELVRSTHHGLAVDCHLEPVETMTGPAITACWFETIG
jgi:hypothetical protein